MNDNVLVTGYDLGSNTDGGYGELIRVPSNWVVPLPQNLSLKESMTLGTAGFTAALCVQALQRSGVKPDQGDIVVTGATGGVGSIAVALLAKEGYSVIASTGKTDAGDFLMNLGAAKIINRSELNDQSGELLLKSSFAGAVDTVGGNTLTTALKSIKMHGSVAACGMVAGPKLDLNVFPFILRGVSLLGIDSAQCPMEQRLEIWRKLASEWKLDFLTSIAQTIILEQLDQYLPAILYGKIRGRIVVSLK